MDCFAPRIGIMRLEGAVTIFFIGTEANA